MFSVICGPEEMNLKVSDAKMRVGVGVFGLGGKREGEGYYMLVWINIFAMDESGNQHCGTCCQPKGDLPLKMIYCSMWPSCFWLQNRAITPSLDHLFSQRKPLVKSVVSPAKSGEPARKLEPAGEKMVAMRAKTVQRAPKYSPLLGLKGFDQSLAAQLISLPS